MEIKTTLNQLNPYQARLDRSDNEKAEARRPSSAPDSGTPAGDRVSLSAEARVRTEAFTAAMNSPEVRQDKVDALKARVQSGEYEVDVKTLALQLLREEPGLFES